MGAPRDDPCDASVQEGLWRRCDRHPFTSIRPMNMPMTLRLKVKYMARPSHGERSHASTCCRDDLMIISPLRAKGRIQPQATSVRARLGMGTRRQWVLFLFVLYVWGGWPPITLLASTAGRAPRRSGGGDAKGGGARARGELFAVPHGLSPTCRVCGGLDFPRSSRRCPARVTHHGLGAIVAVVAIVSIWRLAHPGGSSIWRQS